jgi:hypothetical protein
VIPPIDLCRLLGRETPGESHDGRLAFEAGAGTQRGGQGWRSPGRRRPQDSRAYRNRLR